MDRSQLLAPIVPIDVALIAKITGLSTIGTQPEEYVENKVQKKEIAEIVEAQFGTNMGNQGIVIKDVMTRFCQQANGLQIVEEVQEGRGPSRSHSSSRAMH
jgi:hypothetical protein